MIPATPLRSSHRHLLAPVVLAALMAALYAMGPSARVLLGYEREAIAAGEWWRLASNSLVHLGGYHLLLNLIGLLALLLLCPQPLRAREWLLRWAWLSVATSLGLYAFLPQLHGYVGFSGVLHGLFLLGLWPQVRRGDAIASACLLYLIGKLAWEVYAGAPISDEVAIGGHVVTQSHLFGTLAALAYGLAFRVWRRGETRT